MAVAKPARPGASLQRASLKPLAAGMAAFPCRDSWLWTKGILGRRPERRPVKGSEEEAAWEARCAREKSKERARTGD